MAQKRPSSSTMILRLHRPQAHKWRPVDYKEQLLCPSGMFDAPAVAAVPFAATSTAFAVCLRIEHARKTKFACVLSVSVYARVYTIPLPLQVRDRRSKRKVAMAGTKCLCCTHVCVFICMCMHMCVASHMCMCECAFDVSVCDMGNGWADDPFNVDAPMMIGCCQQSVLRHCCLHSQQHQYCSTTMSSVPPSSLYHRCNSHSDAIAAAKRTSYHHCKAVSAMPALYRHHSNTTYDTSAMYCNHCNNTTLKRHHCTVTTATPPPQFRHHTATTVTATQQQPSLYLAGACSLLERLPLKEREQLYVRQAICLAA